MILRTAIAATVLTLALTGAAQAATCGGAAPADATAFRGPVLEVLDGERLCVALGPDPSTWIPVRLSNAMTQVSTTAPTRGALMAASFGEDVTCRIVGRDADGVVAECASDQGALARLAQKSRIIKAGLAWR